MATRCYSSRKLSVRLGSWREGVIIWRCENYEFVIQKNEKMCIKIKQKRGIVNSK